MYSLVFFYNLLHKLFTLVRTYWLIIFYRLLLYPLLGLVQRRGSLVDLQFMNLGFDEKEEAEEQENLSPAAKSALFHAVPANFPDDVNGRALRAHCLLYERTLAQCPLYGQLEGAKVLEVGCGFGGGMRWLMRAHPELDSLVGLDPNSAISSSSSLSADGISLVSGRAQQLPFPANSFDLVLNVESSHCYGELGEAAFFQEANRVLAPGGFLCWADIRTREELDRTLNTAQNAGFRLASPLEEVNSQVLRGMAKTSARYEQLLDQAPWWVRLFKHCLRTAFAPGASGHEKLASGQHIYVLGCWQKESDCSCECEDGGLMEM